MLNESQWKKLKNVNYLFRNLENNGVWLTFQ